MNTILAILLSLSAIFGHAPATSPEQSTPQVPVQQLLGLDWVSYELALTKVTVPDDVVIHLTSDPTLNCGAANSLDGLGGCMRGQEDGSKLVIVSPELAWTPGGSHVLYHEIGHATLPTLDECAAEWFAAYYTQRYDLWSYPECAVARPEPATA